MRHLVPACYLPPLSSPQPPSPFLLVTNPTRFPSLNCNVVQGRQFGQGAYTGTCSVAMSNRVGVLRPALSWSDMSYHQRVLWIWTGITGEPYGGGVVLRESAVGQVC